jgi:CRP/FNR family transcriptional regulator, cyclic AMP receptor protein
MGLFDYPTESSGALERHSPQSFAFLEHLPRSDWAKILAVVETRHFAGGDDIIRIGERDESFYILTAGTVLVVRPDGHDGEEVIAEIPEGSVFGEVAFFDGQPRSATIRASGKGSAIRVTRANFEHLSAWHPEIARRVLFDLARILAIRLRWTMETSLSPNARPAWN